MGRDEHFEGDLELVEMACPECGASFYATRHSARERRRCRRCARKRTLRLQHEKRQGELERWSAAEAPGWGMGEDAACRWEVVYEPPIGPGMEGWRRGQRFGHHEVMKMVVHSGFMEGTVLRDLKTGRVYEFRRGGLMESAYAE